MRKPSSLSSVCVAEAVGTFVLVFLGLGVVHAAVLTGAQSGLWQVAIVWGSAVTLAIYVVGGISGAHINPAMTIAFAVWGGFPWARVVPYILSQVAGAALAALVLFLLYQPYFIEREQSLGVTRGQSGSELTALCYGEYFPNPAPLSTAEGAYDPSKREAFDARVPHLTAFMAEVMATLLLALVVFAVSDGQNHVAPEARLGPVFVGLTVAVLISVVAPLTQACFNPARDFGPRLVAYFAGWGSIAIPGPRGGFFTVYILAPTLGAILGGGLYRCILGPMQPHDPSSDSSNKDPQP